jgi:hypothetical protein
MHRRIPVKWLALIACLFITTSAGARIDDPIDESKPELVKMYLFFPCDALEDSYEFMYNELTHHTERLVRCHALYDESDYKYSNLMCKYVEMQWQNMYDHMKSVEKAYHIMCNDWGERKDPEYEIDF